MVKKVKNLCGTSVNEAPENGQEQLSAEGNVDEGSATGRNEQQPIDEEASENPNEIQMNTLKKKHLIRQMI